MRPSTGTLRQPRTRVAARQAGPEVIAMRAEGQVGPADRRLKGQSRAALGRYGEDLAAEHLRSIGLRILSRNWRCRQGELDIVAMEDDVLVVCEVKTRSNADFGGPAEAVHSEKLARLHRLAAAWLAEHDVRVAGVRIDVIAIMRPARGPSQLSHLRGV